MIAAGVAATALMGAQSALAVSVKVDQFVEAKDPWGMAAMKDREEVGAASVDYLMYSGYACLAYFWADMARLAAEKLAAGTDEEAFYKAKLQTARFYFQRILPRTRAHVEAMLSGANNLMEMDEEHFALGY